MRLTWQASALPGAALPGRDVSCSGMQSVSNGRAQDRWDRLCRGVALPAPQGPGLPPKDLTSLAHMTSARDVQLDRHNRNSLILVVTSVGEFSFETHCFLAEVGSGMGFIYLKTEFGGIPGADGLPLGVCYPTSSFALKTRKPVLQSITALLTAVKTTLRPLRRRPVDATICSGGSHAVPMCIAARLFGRDIVYLDRVTRVDRLSITGLITYHFRLTKTFFVQ